MAESSGTEAAGKPQVSLVKPARPGSGLMWTGVAVTVLAILAGALLAGGDSDSVTYVDPAAEAAVVAAEAARDGFENATQAGVAEPAVIDHAVKAATAAIAVADTADASIIKTALLSTKRTFLSMIGRNHAIWWRPADPRWWSPSSGWALALGSQHIREGRSSRGQ